MPEPHFHRYAAAAAAAAGVAAAAAAAAAAPAFAFLLASVRMPPRTPPNDATAGSADNTPTTPPTTTRVRFFNDAGDLLRNFRRRHDRARIDLDRLDLNGR